MASGAEMNALGMLDLVRENRNKVLAIAERYGATNVRALGSVALDEDDDQK